MTGLQSTDRQMAPAVQETLENLDLSPEDIAASRLAMQYARAIDRAQAIAADAAKIDLSSADETTVVKVEALRKRVGGHAAVAEIGPKLHTLLNELGATPKARAALSKLDPAMGDQSGSGSGRGALHKLRGA